MNQIILMGRLTKDPKIQYTQSSNSLPMATYTLAVARRGDSDVSDYFNCVTWGKSAEFVEKYLRKGMKIIITGRVEFNKWQDRQGEVHYYTSVIVGEHYFAEKKESDRKKDENAEAYAEGQSFDDNLPFQ